MTIPINDQIHLSQIQPADEAACVEYLVDPDIYAVTLRIPRPYTGESFRGWLEILARQVQANGRATVWAIRNPDSKMIGGCGLDNYQRGGHQAEMGYWLAKPYWGRGIMPAVVERICQIAFTELGLAKVTAHTFAENKASARVLEKCRFRQEGFLRQHHQKDGRLIDARLFGRLAND
jgi:RimJ/RimL family protein N-acetyltransferase